MVQYLSCNQKLNTIHRSPRLKSDRDRYPAIANKPPIVLFVAVPDRPFDSGRPLVDSQLQPFGFQRPLVGVPVRYGGVVYGGEKSGYIHELIYALISMNAMDAPFRSLSCSC